MRLLLALIFSLACHALVFQWLATGNFDRAKSHSNHWHALQVRMQEAPKLPAPAQSLSASTLAAKPITASTLRVRQDQPSTNQTKRQPVHKPDKPESALNQADDIAQTVLTDWWGYYHSSKQVERKALPISNINKDMLGDVLISGMSIKLRLYINQFGQVVKIEDIAVLEQDKPFRDRLAALLMNMTFMAARKDSAEVNSFQDIEFSFQPLMTPDNSQGVLEDVANNH